VNRFIEEPRGLFRRTYRKPRKKRKASAFYRTILLLMLLVTVLTVVLCAWFAWTGANTGDMTGSTSVPETSSGAAGADASSDLPDSSLPESGSSEPEPPALSSQPTSSEMTMILAAEQAFGKNSIDRNHAEAMNQADTMSEMLSVYDDTLEAWRKQLNTMVSKLNAYTTADQKALHSAWEQDAAEKIRAREEMLANQGGTIQQLEVAEYTCMLYRQRGLELFTELYRYENTYTF
jgi:flagellar basal body-associated protein FliL